MEKKEYLNEENYQKSKRKIIVIAVLIALMGILVGGGLIATGIIKSSNAVTEEETGRTKEVIQTEIDQLDEELIPLKAKKNQEFKANGFSEEYYRLDNEISKKEEKITELKSELWKTESGYNSAKDKIEKSKYIPFYMFGGFIIIASFMIAFSVYMFAKRREIIAFTTQQVMPVAQEGMDKMAPTVGNFAKEITKGIKDGIKDDEE